MPLERSTTPSEITAEVDLGLAGGTLHCRLTVPAERTSPLALLPVFRALAENIILLATQEQEREGLQISCKKGCGACCRRLVPVSASEARRIRDYIEELPEERRAEIRRRFAAARDRLDAAGMIPRLASGDGLPREVPRSLGLDYFGLGIPCPFLEDESCSIYEERPIACREYLVTSPAENCAALSSKAVACVPLAGRVSSALMRAELQRGDSTDGWLALALAPEWADSHPDLPRPRSGPDLMRDLFKELTGEKPPPVEAKTMNLEEA